MEDNRASTGLKAPNLTADFPAVTEVVLGMQAPLEPGGLCCDRDGHGDRQADLELRASRATDPHINHSHGPFNTRNPNITPVLNK